jgi:hypothetical protein
MQLNQPDGAAPTGRTAGLNRSSPLRRDDEVGLTRSGSRSNPLDNRSHVLPGFGTLVDMLFADEIEEFFLFLHLSRLWRRVSFLTGSLATVFGQFGFS